LLRIIQEALANVHRHAGASQVSITLRMTGNALKLVVSDDGRGMPGRSGQPEPAQSGVGIPGMRSRLRHFGGVLEIHSGPRGTTLTATVPLAGVRHRAPAGDRLPAIGVAVGDGSHRS
jgi:signal transduction histidine kinase